MKNIPTDFSKQAIFETNDIVMCNMKNILMNEYICLKNMFIKKITQNKSVWGLTEWTALSNEPHYLLNRPTLFNEISSKHSSC